MFYGNVVVVAYKKKKNVLEIKILKHEISILLLQILTLQFEITNLQIEILTLRLEISTWLFFQPYMTMIRNVNKQYSKFRVIKSENFKLIRKSKI